MTPNTIETTVKTDVAATKSWLLLHERLIITVLVLALVAGFGYKILSHEAEKDQAAASAAQQALSIQQDENKQLAAQVQASQQQTQALVAQLTAQNAQLQQGIQSRTVVLQTQQKAIQTLPVPDVVNRWTELTGTDASQMTVTPDGVSITPQAARDTVSQLEEVPVLKANLADTQTQVTNLTTELTASTNLNGLLTTQVSGLKVELADTKTADALTLKAAKADARKGKAKWFGIGYVAGWASAIAVKIF